MNNRKPPTVRDMLVMLEQGDIELPPLELTLDRTMACENIISNTQVDGFLQVRWRHQSETFLIECKSANTPKVLDEAIAQARHYANNLNLQPLIIVPYLSEESLRSLEENETSGVDLCGNGILITEDFQFRRSGQPNRYKDTRPIRNAFSGDSSIFARCFLLRDHYSSLRDLVEFAHQRTFGVHPTNKTNALTQSTASKVVHALIDDLAVIKNGGKLEIQDKRRLLKLLRQGYRKAALLNVTGTTPLSQDQIYQVLREERTKGSLRSVATGLSSAGYYQVLSGDNRLAFYVDNLAVASNKLQIRPGKAFANIELHEYRSNAVYFDSREDGDKLWASPIQTWLELMDQGPREQEAAIEIEQMLLRQHGDTGQCLA